MKYYVNCNTPENGDGSELKPFNTIQKAADAALPGDEVIVLPGIYREQIIPKRGGTENAPTVYRSAEPLAAVITGAELLTDWERLPDGTWTASVPNSIFGDYNPYTTNVSGDWYMAAKPAHTGDVYLNHKSLYEVTDRQRVINPVRSTVSWDPDFSTLVWYAEQSPEDRTIFYVNFGDFDPNKECVEISVRRNCFMPDRTGLDYITLSGFTVREAATQWAPPTAFQDGMIGPHWSKGWIIEDCDIYESKCCGISLGKYLQPENENKWLNKKYKDGTQTERECVCLAVNEGWSKETVGSHTVRRCNIHDCGQTGIAGHMGGAFSVIEENHIHHINNKQNLTGAETGGIKLHAAIDVQIRRNHIHHCTRGLWLDWQAQGTRVTENFFHNNGFSRPINKLMENFAASMAALGEDIQVEVSHGPTIIDNNLLMSIRSLKLPAQGIAVIHNLICGSITAVGTGTDNGAKTLPSPRYTPYHVPHGTAIAGFMTFLHGDCRFFNNIFVGREVPEALKLVPVGARIVGGIATAWDTMNFECGTFPYDDYPTFEEWDRQFEGYCGLGSTPSDRYYSHLPVWTGGNVFFNGARPCKKERDYTVVKQRVFASVIETREADCRDLKTVTLDGYKLITNVFDRVDDSAFLPVTSETLTPAFEPEQRFEAPDGSCIYF